MKPQLSAIICYMLSVQGVITENDYLRASCRLSEQDYLPFYSESQLAYFRQVVDAWEFVYPNC